MGNHGWLVFLHAFTRESSQTRASERWCWDRNYLAITPKKDLGHDPFQGQKETLSRRHAISSHGPGLYLTPSPVAWQPGPPSTRPPLVPPVRPSPAKEAPKRLSGNQEDPSKNIDGLPGLWKTKQTPPKRKKKKQPGDHSGEE